MAMNTPHPPLTTPLTSPPSQSYIHPSPSIPTTPSLLSRQNSSSFFFTPTTTTPSHPPHRLTTARSVPSTPATAGTHPHHHRRRRKHDGTTTTTAAADDDDWLIRTASHLTMSRLEEKGVSWLAARESSTSLRDDDDDGDDGGRGVRYYSANASRQRSYASFTGGGGAGRKSRRGSAEGRNEGVKGGGVPQLQGPDFVDERDEREMRDVLGMGDLEDEEVEEGREGRGGEMGVLVDDREMRRVVMGRIGGWVDWAVGWMDFRDGAAGEQDMEEEEGGEGEDEDGFEKRVVGQLDVEEVKRRLGAKGLTDEEEVTSMRDKVMIPPPPGGDQAGMLSDARWLLTIAGKLAV